MPPTTNPTTAELLAPALSPARPALVRDGVETTFVVPGDWPHSDLQRWLCPDARPATSDVAYLIDGPQTFQSMVKALDTASGQGSFIVLLGWSLDHAFVVDPERGRTFFDIVREKARLGVPVRVLLYYNTDMLVLFDEHGNPTDEAHRVNVNATAALNSLHLEEGLDVACRLDDNTSGFIPLGKVLIETFHPRRAGIHAYGSHHHKILLVQGTEGLIGFCGGIDLDPNRCRALHDVQLRLTGAAAVELLEIAEQRWSTSAHDEHPPTPPTLEVPPVKPASPAAPTPYVTQVVQTVGTPELRKRIPDTLWPAVRHAVRQAARFIYIEDQYLMSLDLVAELVQAADRLRHITVLVPAIAVTEPNTWNLRQQALRELVRLGGPGIEEKIGLFQRARGEHECIHSKLMVFDDEYALIGTANANNRGYFLDSEVAIGVADRPLSDPRGPREGLWYHLEATFPRRLRIELWREHLGLPAAELFDGVGARAHWDSPPPGALVEPLSAIDIKTHKAAGRRYHEALTTWQRRKEASEKLGAPFHAPRPQDPIPPEDTALWWQAPYSDWASFPTAEEQFVDPRQ